MEKGINFTVGKKFLMRQWSGPETKKGKGHGESII